MDSIQEVIEPYNRMFYNAIVLKWLVWEKLAVKHPLKVVIRLQSVTDHRSQCSSCFRTADIELSLLSEVLKILLRLTMSKGEGARTISTSASTCIGIVPICWTQMALLHRNLILLTRGICN